MPAKLRIVEAGKAAPPPPPTAGLVERAQAGDSEALHRVLESVAASVLHATRGVLGSHDPDVKDAAQEAMIGFTRALPSFRGDCSVTTYASRIAARTALHWRRRSSRRRRQAETFAADAEPPAPERDDPLLSVQAKQRLALLRSLLDELPPEQAEALMLRAVLGYSLKEVAAVAEVPVNTVRSRVRLAKMALLERIDADASQREIWELER